MFTQRVQDGDTEWLQQRLNVVETEEEASLLANASSQGLSVLMLAIRCNYPNVSQRTSIFGPLAE